MQQVSTYNSHLQATLRTVIALQGGCVHLGSNVAYSVFAGVFYTLCGLYLVCFISRVKCVACVRLLVSVVLLILELSVGVGGGGVAHLYFCMFLLSVYGAVAPRF